MVEQEENKLPLNSGINQVQNNEIPPNYSKPFLSKKIAIFALISLILGSLLGGIIGKTISKESTQVQTYKVNKPVSVFPIDLNMIQNPMFSEWSGRVKGRLKEIKKDSILISEIKEEFKPNGQRLVEDINNPNLTEIFNNEDTTKFFVSTSSPEGRSELSPVAFNQLQIGTIIEGRVKIVYDSAKQSFKLIGVALTER